MGIRKQTRPVKVFNCSNTHDLAALSLLALCRQREPESKSIQKETLVSTCLKSFLSVVVSLPSLLSHLLLGMLKITFSPVLPLSVLFHVVNTDFSLPVSYRLSANSAFPVYFLDKDIIGDVTPSLEMRFLLPLLAACCSIGDYILFASYQIWHIYWLIYLSFKESRCFFPPAYQHMLKVKALKWVSRDLDSHPDLSVHQFITAVSWE